MAHRFFLAGWVGLSLCTAAAAPDPLDAQAAVPAATHRSALDTYRRHGEVKPVPWREANDTVERIGGWRTYAREAAVPAPAASAPASAPAAAPSRASPPAATPTPAPAPAAPVASAPRTVPRAVMPGGGQHKH